MSGSTGIGIGVTAVTVGGLLYFAFAPVKDAEIAAGTRLSKEESRRPYKPSKDKKVREQNAEPVSTQRVGKVTRKGKPIKMQALEDWFAKLPSATDRAIAKRIQDAIDENDLEALRNTLDDAKASSSAEVRQHAVEAFGWFGKDALVDLTGFLSDKDEDVARTAFNAWDAAVDEMDDNAARTKVIGMAMAVLTDKDSLSSAAAKLEASADRKASVNAVIDIIESGNATASKAAREAYEFIVGEPYKSASLARARVVIMDYTEKSGD